MCGVWEADVCCARGIFGEVFGVATPFDLRFVEGVRSMRYGLGMRR